MVARPAFSARQIGVAVRDGPRVDAVPMSLRGGGHRDLLAAEFQLLDATKPEHVIVVAAHSPPLSFCRTRISSNFTGVASPLAARSGPFQVMHPDELANRHPVAQRSRSPQRCHRGVFSHRDRRAVVAVVGAAAPDKDRATRRRSCPAKACRECGPDPSDETH